MMSYLLDTHTFHWYDARPEKLSDQAATICKTFDRLLLAQALVEDIPLLSSDSNLAAYPVKVIW